MNKEITKNEIRKYNNEIDLVDLLKILIKNKMIIILTTIIVTAFSVGGALYIRSNRIDKFQQNFRLRDYADVYYRGKAKLIIKSFNIEEMLLKDDILNVFYANEDFNQYFSEKINGKTITSDDKRNFLESSLKLERITENKDGKDIFKYYTLNTTIEDKGLSKKMIDLYLTLINTEKVHIIKEAIANEGDLVLQKRDFYEKKVKEDEKKIAEIIKKQPTAILENQSIMSIITITNPSLLQEVNNNKNLYAKYYDQAVGIEGLKEDKNLNQQIEKLSSIYKVEEKSKSKMIVALGIIMGLFLGIFVAFIKEFFANVDLKK